MGIAGRTAAHASIAALVVLALGACSSLPRIQVDDDVVLGCPAPLGPNDPPETLEGWGAALAFGEALTLCDDELITYGEDRELQQRLLLQERLEKIDRKRARAARQAQGRAMVDVAWDAPPRG
jgi:hypothetical protein